MMECTANRYKIYLRPLGNGLGGSVVKLNNRHDI